MVDPIQQQKQRQQKPPEREFLESKVSPLHDSQQYRDCNINGIKGVWEAQDVYELLKSLGHNLLCRRVWYLPVSKCVGDFQHLRHKNTYKTRHSK